MSPVTSVQWDDGKPQLFSNLNAGRIFVGRSPRSIAVAPGKLITPSMDVVVVRVKKGHRVFKLRHDLWRHRTGLEVRPPAGERVPKDAAPVLTQDGMMMLTTLRDRHGELDLGIFDLVQHRWRVRDYAWSPAASPVPIASGGSISARRAVGIATDLIRLWHRAPAIERLLTGTSVDQSLIPFRYPSFANGTPRHDDRGWTVPTVVYGNEQGSRKTSYRDIDIRVHLSGTRVTAHPISRGPVTPIETIPQAIALLQKWVTTPVVLPELPAGTKLRGHSLSLWTNRGQTTADLQLGVPAGVGSSPRSNGTVMTLSFGAAFFSGCGGIRSKPLTLGGLPALSGRQGGFNSVVWPATKHSYRNSGGAEFGVSGDVPRRLVLDVARGIRARS